MHLAISDTEEKRTNETGKKVGGESYAFNLGSIQGGTIFDEGYKKG